MGAARGRSIYAGVAVPCRFIDWQGWPITSYSKGLALPNFRLSCPMASVSCWSRFLLFLISSQIVVLAQAECYFPGGGLATDQYPCDSSAATSLCCPSGWTCSPNSNCVFTDEEDLGSTWPLTSKGTCTDPEWDETACGHFYLGL